MNEEEKKAIKVINKRTERLSEELKIEQEDFIDEPRIAYLITQIEANETLLNLIEKQEKVIDYMVDRIEWLMKSNGIVLDFEHKDNFTKEDIKEFFYRKVENNE